MFKLKETDYKTLRYNDYKSIIRNYSKALRNSDPGRIIYYANKINRYLEANK